MSLFDMKKKKTDEQIKATLLPNSMLQHHLKPAHLALTSNRCHIKRMAQEQEPEPQS